MRNIEDGETKKKLLIIVAAIFLVGIGIWLWLSQSGGGNILGGINNKSGTGVGENAEQTFETATRKLVPENIKVPEMGVTSTNPEIAVPRNVAPAAPGVDAKGRFYEITAENNKYTPSEVIVNQGDTVNIKFTAKGKGYDITFPDYGMKQTAKDGETKTLEFQAINPGKFLYYCESCGGMDGDTKGYFIIVPKGE